MVEVGADAAEAALLEDDDNVAVDAMMVARCNLIKILDDLNLVAVVVGRRRAQIFVFCCFQRLFSFFPPQQSEVVVGTFSEVE